MSFQHSNNSNSRALKLKIQQSSIIPQLHDQKPFSRRKHISTCEEVVDYASNNSTNMSATPFKCTEEGTPSPNWTNKITDEPEPIGLNQRKHEKNDLHIWRSTMVCLWMMSDGGDRKKAVDGKQGTQNYIFDEKTKRQKVSMHQFSKQLLFW